jgi:hypothetical protein
MQGCAGCICDRRLRCFVRVTARNPNLDALEMWRLARMLIEQHQDRAAFEAAKKVSDLTMQGNQHVANEWGDILAAIAVLQSRRPPVQGL